MSRMINFVLIQRIKVVYPIKVINPVRINGIKVIQIRVLMFSKDTHQVRTMRFTPISMSKTSSRQQMSLIKELRLILVCVCRLLMRFMLIIIIAEPCVWWMTVDVVIHRTLDIVIRTCVRTV